MRLSEIADDGSELPLDVSMLFKLLKANVPVFFMVGSGRYARPYRVHDPVLGMTKATGRQFLEIFISSASSTDSRHWTGDTMKHIELKKRDGRWMMRDTRFE
jgi:hypothetical protein